MNIVVVGLGYVGLPLAVEAAKFGFKVQGFDTNAFKISQLKSGNSPLPDTPSHEISLLIKNQNLSFVSKLEKNEGKSIFIIAVPTPLKANKKPDMSMLESACIEIGSVVKENDLVINESTSYVGTLRNFIKPIIQRKSGLEKINFAVAPERIDPGNQVWTIKNTPRNVAGLTEVACSEVFEFYSKFCGTVNKFSSPEEVEAAKLIENAFRQVNIAFINELAKLSAKLKFSIHNAIGAAATKPFGFMPFYPSIGVGGHCIPVDSYYLTYTAAEAGMNLELVDSANKVNLSMAKFIVEKIKSDFEYDFRGKRIQLAGVSYKINSADIRESPALTLISILRSEGATVIWHDPIVQSIESEISSPLESDIDMGLIVTPHNSIDFSIWKKIDKIILDISSSPKNFGWEKFF